MSGGGGGSNDLWRPLPALACPLPCSLVLSGPKRPCWVLGTKSRALNIQEGETKPLPPLSPAAPSAPSSVKFSELTTTSVNVSWEAPQFPNGILEGYRLVYEPCTPVDGEWGAPSQLGSLDLPSAHTLPRTPTLHRVPTTSSHCKRGDRGPDREGTWPR